MFNKPHTCKRLEKYNQHHDRVEVHVRDYGTFFHIPFYKENIPIPYCPFCGASLEFLRNHYRVTIDDMKPDERDEYYSNQELTYKTGMIKDGWKLEYIAKIPHSTVDSVNIAKYIKVFPTRIKTQYLGIEYTLVWLKLS